MRINFQITDAVAALNEFPNILIVKLQNNPSRIRIFLQNIHGGEKFENGYLSTTLGILSDILANSIQVSNGCISQITLAVSALQ